ncbi:hypothetical protein GCM10027168_14260 [Streptomyces capparidis]
MAGRHGHSHAAHDETTAVAELDGVPVVVSVDHDGVLWTCDLRGGECEERPLELDAAGPDDDWWREHALGDDGSAEDGEDGEDAEYGEDPDEEWPPAWEADAYEVVSTLTVAHLGGRPVVVTGGGRFDLSHPDLETMGGAVRVWDLRTGRKVGGTLTGHGLGVRSLTTLPHGRGLLVVSSSEEGRLLAWDLPGGTPVANVSGGYDGAMGAALVDGRPIAVTGGGDPFLQVWDLLRGEELGQPLTGVEPAAGAVALAGVDGRAVVVAGDGGGALRMWDLATREPLGSAMAGHEDVVETLATATVAGRAIAVSGGRDETTRVWDLARGEQLGEPFAGHRLRMLTEVAGVPVAVTTDSGGGVRLWDLARAVR